MGHKLEDRNEISSPEFCFGLQLLEELWTPLTGSSSHSRALSLMLSCHPTFHVSALLLVRSTDCWHVSSLAGRFKDQANVLHSWFWFLSVALDPVPVFQYPASSGCQAPTWAKHERFPTKLCFLFVIRKMNLGKLQNNRGPTKGERVTGLNLPKSKSQTPSQHSTPRLGPGGAYIEADQATETQNGE